MMLKKLSGLLILAAALVLLPAGNGLCQETETETETRPETINISTSYHNLLSNPEHTGLLDRVVTEALKRLGIRAELVYAPTARSLVDVNNGLADAEINRIAGMELKFPNLVRVPEPNMVMDFVAFSKKPFPIKGWESIKALNIGIIRGWKIFEENTAGFPGVTLVPSEQELFRMLDKDRLDVALYSRLTGLALLKEEGYGDRISALEPPLARREMYLYLHKSHAALAGDIAESLRSMKNDGTYEQIVNEVLAGHLD